MKGFRGFMVFGGRVSGVLLSPSLCLEPQQTRQEVFKLRPLPAFGAVPSTLFDEILSGLGPTP